MKRDLKIDVNFIQSVIEMCDDLVKFAQDAKNELENGSTSDKAIAMTKVLSINQLFGGSKKIVQLAMLHGIHLARGELEGYDMQKDEDNWLSGTPHPLFECETKKSESLADLIKDLAEKLSK